MKNVLKVGNSSDIEIGEVSPKMKSIPPAIAVSVPILYVPVASSGEQFPPSRSLESHTATPVWIFVPVGENSILIVERSKDLVS